VPPRYVAIANPDSRRWQAYAGDLAAFWEQRGVRPEVVVVPWRDVVARDGNLDGLTAFDRPAIVRIESPGRDHEVARLLLEAGERDTRAAPGFDWRSLPFEKGRILRPGLFYRGFRRALRGLASSFAERQNLWPLSCPLDIADLFDKNATQARLEQAGLPCPPSLEPPATPAALFDALRVREWPAAYVKLATGSSASGCAVVHALAQPPWAISSVAVHDGRYYNSRRLRRHEGASLEAVLRLILAEGACVQRGVPMARIDGLNFDVRVVVIYGRPAITVFRLSAQPMTNLHLGGRRGDPVACRAAIPRRTWLDALDHCCAAAALYDCAVVGVDLLFERGFYRHHILEVNAFGDFFPGLVDERGRSAHRVEIEETVRRLGS
jgi:hypothetical protein